MYIIYAKRCINMRQFLKTLNHSKVTGYYKKYDLFYYTFLYHRKQPIVEFLAERYTHKNAFKGQIIAQFFTKYFLQH